jgi:hypothetical protein
MVGAFMIRIPLADVVFRTTLVDELTNVLLFIVSAIAKYVNLFYE